MDFLREPDWRNILRENIYCQIMPLHVLVFVNSSTVLLSEKFEGKIPDPSRWRMLSALNFVFTLYATRLR